MEQMAKSCLAMAVGSGLFASEILNKARKKMGANVPIAEIGDWVRKTYVDFRNDRVEEHGRRRSATSTITRLYGA